MFEVTSHFLMPQLVLHCYSVVEHCKQGAFGAVLKHDEHSFLFLGVDGFFEPDDVGVLKSQQEVCFCVDHFDQLFLLNEVLLPDFLEPQNLDCLYQ